MRKLHGQLRQPERYFTLAATTPRMLPRAFDPTRLDVAPQHDDSPPKVRVGGGRWALA